MLNKKNNKEPKPNSQEPDQKSSSRFRYSPELKRICLMNEAGEIVNSTEEAPKVTLDYDNSYILTMRGSDMVCLKQTNFHRQESLQEKGK